ncbi:MAG: tyrosine-type recombinase/integrase [Planctomycetaceae bacterium]|nr:tyrosine-type recombinase/integrase [Planctomycetaceae bacterium]
MVWALKRKHSAGGKIKTAKKYTGFYIDRYGKTRKVKGFTDKGATLEKARQLERQEALIRDGLVEEKTVNGPIPIEDHVKAFRTSLGNKDVTDRQVDQVEYRVNRIITLCEFKTAETINEAAVDDALAKLRKEQKLSAQTSNHYLTAMRQFTRWLARHKRIADDPLTTLEKLNVQVDRRHDRRALSDDEVTKILDAARTGKVSFAFTGEDRLMLYALALSTGLRASELASLTPESLDLNAVPPICTVQAGNSKRRRKDVLPLPSGILDQFREWLARKPKGEKLWPGPWAEYKYAGKMLQVDLAVAGVTYKDANGLFADFHALRHTYITNLGRQGVPLTTAQKLARHSTPVLTAARYTHIDLPDQHRAVEQLPVLKLGRELARTNDTNGHSASQNGSARQSAPESTESEIPGKTVEKSSKTKRRGRDSPTLPVPADETESKATPRS